MGNSIGADLSVQIDQKGPVSGGEKLTGIIYLNVERKISADSLIVKFYGQESTQCVDLYAGEDVLKEKDRFFCLNYVLHRFNNRLANKGQYEYPFKIIIPMGLPGKFGVKHDKDNWIKGSWFVVEYFLEARLHREGILGCQVKNKHEILLSDPPVNHQSKTPSSIEPIIRPVFFCGCYKTGKMTLLANVDTTTILMGDNFQIEYAIRNESTAKVQRIEIVVWEICKFEARDEGLICLRSLKKKNSSIIHKQQIQVSGGSDYFDSMDSINSLFKADKAITAQVSSAYPSYHGRLIDVSHFIELKFITTKLSKNFQIDIPITLVRNQDEIFKGILPAVKTAYELPADWHWQPVKFPMKDLNKPF
jgi:hypothetical protein